MNIVRSAQNTINLYYTKIVIRILIEIDSFESHNRIVIKVLANDSGIHWELSKIILHLRRSIKII